MFLIVCYCFIMRWTIIIIFLSKTIFLFFSVRMTDFTLPLPALYFFKISVVASTCLTTGVMNVMTKGWELKGIIVNADDNAGTSLRGPVSKVMIMDSDMVSLSLGCIL